MKMITREELKASQLEILDVIANFCDKHDIKYFLAFGTLIGAVRHKGYIPWDDDIDIAMLRADYDKFMSMFNEYNMRFRFVCMENDEQHYYPWGGQVKDSERDLEWVRVDIFHIDNAPAPKDMKKYSTYWSIYKTLHHARVCPVFAKVKGNILRRIAAYSFRLCVKLLGINLFPRRYFAEKLIQVSKKYALNENKRVIDFCTQAMMDKSGFEKLLDAEFEGRHYKIPACYDEWLTKVYGDYMTPPPVKERKAHGFLSDS